MAYFILSMDGGGIRGVLTARVLERLEQQHPFLERVQLFTGTSTGGILALALAKGMSPGELVKLYVENGAKIFSSRDLLDRVVGPLDELVRADYSIEPLKAVLSEHFGGHTLGDLLKRVLIPTFDLDNEAERPAPRHWKPKFFHNFKSPGNDSAQSVLDVAVRTSAAPTYFATYQGYIDGGVVVSNPATCALAQAIKEGERLGEVRLLSVGTGFNPQLIHGDTHDWGKTQWLGRIIQLMLDGMPGVANYQCEALLADRYCRVQTMLDEVVELDGVAQIPRLLEIADRLDLTPALAFLDTQVDGSA